jgi:hypothetical protein
MANKKKSAAPAKPETPVAGVSEPQETAPKPAASAKRADPDQARWEAFLEAARVQAEENGTMHIFEEQKRRGEFDTIPASFRFGNSVREAE